MPVFSPQTAVADITVKDTGLVIGTRSKINLHEGSNVALAAADNSPQNRIDVTIGAVQQSYAQAVIALGPSSFWKLDELSGTTAVDVNSLVNGTYGGTYTLGQAPLTSSGSAASVQIGSASVATGGVNLGSASYLMSGVTNYTWTAWINLLAVDTSAGVYIVQRLGTVGGLGSGWSCQIGSLSSTTYYIEQVRVVAGGGVWTSALGPYSPGQRHFAAFTYDGSNQRTYIDGVLAATSADTRSITSSATPSLIFGNGGSATNDHGLRGLLGMVAVWQGRALSTAEIAGLYSAGL